MYKILSPDLKECYVGSTIDEKERWREHKKNRNNCCSRILFEKYGVENCKFVVMEVCPIEEKRVKEQWWMDHSVGVVNKQGAFRTDEEHKIISRECVKVYRNNHIEERRAYGRTYHSENRDSRNEKSRAYYQANREKILAQKLAKKKE